MSVLGSAQVKIRFVAGLSPSCANLARMCTNPSSFCRQTTCVVDMTRVRLASTRLLFEDRHTPSLFLAGSPKLKQNPCLLTAVFLPRTRDLAPLPTCGSLSQDCGW